jgi:Ca2+-binding RTX toxin-like protein
VRGLFRTDNAGEVWTRIPLPSSSEGAFDGFDNDSDGRVDAEDPDEATAFRLNAGGSSQPYLSLMVDPANPQLIYVGGDRQPPAPEGAAVNDLGCSSSSARLFRGVIANNSVTWEPLVCNGAGGTSPFRGSRQLVLDASGEILEADDGGVYRLTSVSLANSRRWVSSIGNLQISELDAIAYDSLGDHLTATSSVGTVSQSRTGTSEWRHDSVGPQGDGTASRGLQVAAATVTNNGEQATSFEYSIEASLNGEWYLRKTITSDGISTSTFPALQVLGAERYDEAGVYQSLSFARIAPSGRRLERLDSDATPILAVNAVGSSGQRLLIGTDVVYESLNGGETWTTDLSCNVPEQQGDSPCEPASHWGDITALLYGGKAPDPQSPHQLIDHPDVILVANRGADRLLLRTETGGSFRAVPGFPGQNILDMAFDPEDWHTVYVLADNRVYRGAGLGGEVRWSDITGNWKNRSVDGASPSSPLSLRSLEVIRGQSENLPQNSPQFNVVFVGALDGVYKALDFQGDATFWVQYGQELPRVEITDLDYDPVDDVLVASTFGRGAWKTYEVSRRAIQIDELRIRGTSGDDSVRLDLDDSRQFLFVRLNDGEVHSLPLRALYGINVMTGTGDDVVDIDLYGQFSLPLGITVDGGENGLDTLRVHEQNLRGIDISKPVIGPNDSGLVTFRVKPYPLTIAWTDVERLGEFREPSPSPVTVERLPEWVPQGPGPILGGQSQRINCVVGVDPPLCDNPVSGAVTSIAVSPDPDNQDLVFVGTANGGIWRTKNARIGVDGIDNDQNGLVDDPSETPSWTPLTDHLPSLAISALAFDPYALEIDRFGDFHYNTLYAGAGRVSSGAGFRTDTGLYRTTDGGATWEILGENTFAGLTVTKIVATRDEAGSPRIFVATMDEDLETLRQTREDRSGLYVNEDATGQRWRRVSGAAWGLPNGSVTDLIQDPALPSRLYAAISGNFDVDGNAGDSSTAAAGDLIPWANKGVYRSDDGGATWLKVSSSWVMSEDTDGCDNDGDGRRDNSPPSTSDRQEGLQRSRRIRLSAGNSGTPGETTSVFAAVLSDYFSADGGAPRCVNPRIEGVFLRNLFHTLDAGQTWSNLTLPTTPEGAVDQIDNDGDLLQDAQDPDESSFYGVLAAGQGDRHFSMVVDPMNPKVVYLGGDRQPTETSTSGCSTFTGRIFRGDASAANIQWQSVVCGELEAGGSAPHADSRFMVFDAHGDLLEANDGGLYRFGRPDNASRRWMFLGGNMEIAEVYAVAYDNVNDILLGAFQDVGAAGQREPGDSRWDAYQLGDGVSAAVEPIYDQAGQPVGAYRYTAFQGVGNLTRRFFDANNAPVGDAVEIGLRVLGTGVPSARRRLTEGGSCDPKQGALAFDCSLDFFSRVVLDSVSDPAITGQHRLLIASNFLYESFDRGDTLIPLLGPVPAGGLGSTHAIGRVSSLLYGGTQAGVANPDVILAAVGGVDRLGVNWPTKLWLRSTAGGTLMPLPTDPEHRYPGGVIRAMAFDPDDWRTVYVVDTNNVYRATNLGPQVKWERISGNLPPSILSDVVVVADPISHQDVVVVAGNQGVFRAVAPNLAASHWVQVGTELPQVFVADLQYDEVDDLLIAGTNGRGIWTLPNALTALRDEARVTIDAGNGSHEIVVSIDPINPQLMRIQVDQEPAQVVPWRSISALVVNGGEGDDTLVVDTTYGQIELGQIVFDGGPDSPDSTNSIVLRDVSFATSIPENLSPDENGAGRLTLSAQGQKTQVAYTNVDFVIDETGGAFGPMWRQLRQLAGGLAGIAKASQQWTDASLLSSYMPLLGDSLGRALLAQEPLEFEPILFPEGQESEIENENGAEALLASGSAGSTDLISRLLAGAGFSLEELGYSVLTFAELRERLDGLDEIAGNVSYEVNEFGVRFDMTVSRELSGRGELDLRGLGGAVNIGGQVDVSANVALHLVFGLDADGFYVDAEGDPEPELTVSQFRLEGDVSGSGRLGMLEVELVDGVLVADPRVHLSVDLREPGPDPLTQQTDGRVRGYEWTQPELFDATWSGNPIGEDLAFYGQFEVSPVEEGQTAPFALQPGWVAFHWSDISLPQLESLAELSATTPTNQIDVGGQELLQFLRTTTDEWLAGWSSFASQLPQLSQVDALAVNLGIAKTTLGEIFESSPDAYRIDNTSLVYVSNPTPVLERFESTVVVGEPQSLLRAGVQAGDVLSYTDKVGRRVADAVIESVTANGLTLSYAGAADRAPRSVNPDFQIQRQGTLANQFGTLVQQAFAEANAPTLQDLARRLAALSQIPSSAIELSSSGTGENRVVELTAKIDPGLMTFRQSLDLSAVVPGLTLSSPQDNFVFEMDTSFRLQTGMRLGSEIPFGERFYLKSDSTPEFTLNVQARIDNPASPGAVGFLDVRLLEDPTLIVNDGVTLQGIVSLNLVDSGVEAADGRVSVTELSTRDRNTLAGMVRSTVDMVADIDGLQLRANVPGAVAPQPLLMSLDGATPQGRITSVEALGDLPQRVRLANVATYTNYNNIQANGVNDILNALEQRLTELTSSGAFQVNLPLLNVDLAGMIDVGQIFGDRLGNPDPGATAASLQSLLRSRFSNVQTTITASDLRFAISFPIPLVHLSLPLALDLGGALGGLVSANASGQVQVDVDGNVQLTFGISTAPALNVLERGFVAMDGTSRVTAKLTANAGYDLNGDNVLSAAEGTPLQFDVGLGPLPVLGVRDARVYLNAEFGAQWRTASGKSTLQQIGEGLFSVEGAFAGKPYQGTLQAVLPLDGNGDGVVNRDPAQLASTDAWVDVAGNLANLTGGLQFISDPNRPAHHTGPVATPGATGLDDPLTLAELNAISSTQIVVGSYNVAGLLEALTSFDPNQLADLLNGLDGFLNTLEVLLDRFILVKKLPLIGDKLADAVDFVDELRQFIAEARQAPNLALDVVKQKLFETLGPTGAGLLALTDLNQDGAIGWQDISVDTTRAGQPVANVSSADRIQFNLLLHKDLARYSLPIDFDLGFDAVGLELKPGSRVNLDVGLDYRLGFGVSRSDGFYYVTEGPAIPGRLAANEDLKISFSATIPNSEFEGNLFFLRVLVQDGIPCEPGGAICNTLMSGSISADFKDPIHPDGRLTWTEFAALPQASLSDLVTAAVNIATDINLKLRADFGDAAFPDLAADFHLNWTTSADTTSGPLGGAAPLVEYRNIRLGVGTFFSEFLKPIFDTIDGVLAPVRPVLNMVRTPLPGFSDLPQSIISAAQLDRYPPANEVTLLDLGKLFFPSDPLFQTIEVIDRLDTIVAKMRQAPSASVEIPIGDFRIQDDVRALRDLQQISVAAISDLLDALDQLSGEFGDFIRELLNETDLGSVALGQQRPIFVFPLIEHPETAIRLLLGQPVNLFEFNPPIPNVNQPIKLPFRLGPLVVGLEGLLKVDFHLSFGFDTYGIQRAFETGDAGRVFAGFFVSDTQNADGTGPDVPEVSIQANMGVFGGLDIFLADFTVRGGVFTDQLKLDLYDPPTSRDGRIRPDEFGENFPTCVFESSGSLRTGLYAEAAIKIDLGFKEIRKTIFSHPFDERTLLDLSTSCDPGKQPPPPPVLATNIGNGVLRLNMGPFASARERGDLTDGDEVFTVAHVSSSEDGEVVEVQAFGLRQRFSGVTQIYAEGGVGNDRIEILGGVISTSELWGDMKNPGGNFGNDVLMGGDGVAQLHGGAGDDQLFGRAAADQLYGEEGNDVLSGAGGNDRLEGGAGNDQLRGGDGEDLLQGDQGDDQLFGESGNDQLSGGSGDDFIAGDSGNDVLEGLDGDDVLDGGEGNDQLSGFTGRDQLIGGADDDLLFGDEDDDTLSGGSGRDTLLGGVGDDSLYGDADSDLLDGGAGGDLLDGGDGADDLQGGLGPDRLYGGAENDRLRGGSDDASDLLAGGSGDDNLDGEGGADVAYGEEGNDVIYGQAGNDRLNGGAGDDTIEGGEGDDQITGDEGRDTLWGGAGLDSLSGGAGNDRLDGGDDADVLLGGDGNDSITGGAGADDLEGDDGDDTLEGQAGSDLITGDAGNDRLDGGSENDLMYGRSGVDLLIGGDGDDRLWGDEGNDTIEGGKGVDQLSGGTGDDLLLGGEGRDNIEGDQGNDQLIGGPGNDILVGAEGDDQLWGGIENDFVYGGAGQDRLYGEEGDDYLEAGAGDDQISGGWGEDLLVQIANADQTLANHSLDGQGHDTFDDIERVHLFGGAGNNSFDVSEWTSSGAQIFGAGGNDRLVVSRDSDFWLSDWLIQVSWGGVIGLDSIEDAALTGGSLPNRFDLTNWHGTAFVDGQESADRVDLREVQSLVLVNGQWMRNNGGPIGLIAIEAVAVWGTPDDDVLDARGFSGTTELFGLDGNDALYGGSASDLLDGGRGSDHLLGGAGDDRMFAGRGADEVLEGEEGDDILEGSPDGQDQLKGGPGRDRIDGHGGNDIIWGDAGDDVLQGGDGDDTIIGGPGADLIVGGADQDQLYAFEVGIAGAGLVADDLAVNVVYGDSAGSSNSSAGNDRLFGGGGNDQLYGEGGDDAIDSRGGTGDLIDFGTGESIDPESYIALPPTPPPTLNSNDEPVSSAPATLPRGVNASGRWAELAGSASGRGVSGDLGMSVEPALVMASTGPVLAWADNRSGSFQIYLAQFANGEWRELGDSAQGGGVSATRGDSRHPSLAIDDQGNPLVAWTETAGSISEIHVAKYVPSAAGGAGAWESLGDSRGAKGISNSGAADDARIIWTANGPVVAWIDRSLGVANVYAKRFVGGVWEELGANAGTVGGISASTYGVSQLAMAASGDQVAIAWTERHAAANRVYVREFDGQQWRELAGSASGLGVSNSVVAAEAPSLAYHNGQLWVAWQEKSTGYWEIRAARYQTQQWVVADGAVDGRVSNSRGAATQPQLAAAGGKLQLMWLDDRIASKTGNTVALYTRSWNGTRFVEALPGDASLQGVGTSQGERSLDVSVSLGHPVLAVDQQGHPYAAWTDRSAGGPEIYLRGDTLDRRNVYFVNDSNQLGRQIHYVAWERQSGRPLTRYSQTNTASRLRQLLASTRRYHSGR